MLTITELRFGNRAMWKTGSEAQVSEFVTTMDMYKVLSANRDTVTLYPVPITEKLLIERCGMNALNFKPTDKFNPDDVKVFGNAGGVIIQRAFFPTGGFVFHYKEMRVMLKGLHHLQNLVYNIFDSELVIK